jgi:hypothetical protein
MLEPSCLVISQENDMSAHAVRWSLEASGASCVWLRSGSLADSALPALAFSVDGRQGVVRQGALNEVEWTGVLCRLHRDPVLPQLRNPEDKAFVEAEWAVFQQGVLALGSGAIGALWVNCPVMAARAESKLLQLQEALRSGLKVPDTLIGNDADAIGEFLRRTPNAVYKPFRTPTWTLEGRALQTPATRLPRGAQLDPRALALCPGIYQAVVEKRADWRVTVMGQRVLAARIKAHDDPDQLDWRPGLLSQGRERCAPGEPPQHIVEAIHRFMAGIGLSYGAIDLVEDRDGEFWFLEVNPFGQFLFVEDLLPELPLLQSLCAMLLEGRADYDPERCRGVSLAAFRNSEAYAQFRAARAA